MKLRVFLPMRIYLPKRDQLDDPRHPIRNISWKYRSMTCAINDAHVVDTTMLLKDLFGPSYLECETLDDNSYQLSLGYEKSIHNQLLIFETNNQDRYVEYMLKCIR